MNGDLTHGPVMKTMLRFAIPMIVGNLLQQCYNVADTLIVGRFLGANALAAVGSSYTLMTFLTSILLGLCMGSSAVFSIRFGQKDENALKEGIFCILPADSVFYRTVKCGCVGRYGRYDSFSAGSRRNMWVDEGIPVGYFLRYCSYLSIQLFCVAFTRREEILWRLCCSWRFLPC